MSIDDDEGLMRTLAALGVTTKDLIAIGGEACVFRYGADSIARIAHAHITLTQVQKRRALLAELAPHGGDFSFQIPQVERLVAPFDRVVTIEPRLPGVTLKVALETATQREAEELVVSALEAARELGSVNFTRPTYRDLFWEPPTQHASWRGYLVRRAERSLALAGERFTSIDARSLVAPFAEPSRPGFVHFDLYPGNILMVDGRVSALIDFGGMAMAGDPRWDPVSLALYVACEVTSPTLRWRKDLCRTWLEAHELWEWLEPAEPVLAAIWSFAQDETTVAAWTRRVLLSSTVCSR